MDSASRSVFLRIWLPAALLLSSLLAYFGVFQFQFVFDDQALLVENPIIRSWKFLPAYFSTSLEHAINPRAAGDYYRPIYLLWQRLNYAAFGLHPAGWHAAALLLHLLAPCWCFAWLCAWFQQGRFRQAEPYLLQAVAIDADDAISQFYLGWSRLEDGRPAEAIPPLEKALALSPSAPHYSYLLGLACQRTGDLVRARSLFQQDLRLHPGDPDAQSALAQIDSSSLRKNR